MEFWDLDQDGWVNATERAQSDMFFKEWFKEHKYPKKWWQDWIHEWPPQEVEKSPEGPALPENPLGKMIALGFDIKINNVSLFEVVGKALREAEKTPYKEGAIEKGLR